MMDNSWASIKIKPEQYLFGEGGAVSYSLTNPSQSHSDYGEKDEWRRCYGVAEIYGMGDMKVVEWQSPAVAMATHTSGVRTTSSHLQQYITHTLRLSYGVSVTKSFGAVHMPSGEKIKRI
jgi:hypothetical protein